MWVFEGCSGDSCWFQASWQLPFRTGPQATRAACGRTYKEGWDPGIDVNTVYLICGLVAWGNGDWVGIYFLYNYVSEGVRSEYRMEHIQNKVIFYHLRLGYSICQFYYWETILWVDRKNMIKGIFSKQYQPMAGVFGLCFPNFEVIIPYGEAVTEATLQRGRSPTMPPQLFPERWQGDMLG